MAHCRINKESKSERSGCQTKRLLDLEEYTCTAELV